jgi:hypothetical protein
VVVAHFPFTLSTITSKVEVYAPAEREDIYTPPISPLPLYVLFGGIQREGMVLLEYQAMLSLPDIAHGILLCTFTI